MGTVKVSPEFEVVIPKKIRAALELKPGEELQIYVLDTPARSRRCAACSGKMIIVTAATASKLVVPGLTTL